MLLQGQNMCLNDHLVFMKILGIQSLKSINTFVIKQQIKKLHNWLPLASSSGQEAGESWQPQLNMSGLV